MKFRHLASRRNSAPIRVATDRTQRQFNSSGLETLESRQLMAAGPLGINLSNSLGFVDLMKEARNFTSLNGSTLPLSATGWPEADAEIIVLDDRDNQYFNGPDPNAVPIDVGGTYHLSFTGRATLGPGYANNYTVENQVYNASTNTTTADLVVTHNSLQMVYIDFTSTYNPASSTGAGVSNVKLLQPGYAADSTQLFSNDMLNSLKPFTTIRYLNINAANNYAPAYDANGTLVPLEWSQRRLPNAASQTTGPGTVGEAWEYMIALANATNTDMWINVPAPASNDYVTQLANLIKNGDTVDGVTYPGLNPNLKVNIEFSNEVWGGTYSTTLYNEIAASQRVQAGGTDLNNDGSADFKVWSQRFYLERSMEITNLFRGVFGADPNYDRVRPMLGWQEGNDEFYTKTFPWFEQTHGAPRDYFYGMGNANYGDATDLSSVDAAIKSLYAGLPGQFATTARFTTVATYYGLQNVAYEGGPVANSANAAQGQIALATVRDPRMEDYTAKLYSTWYSAGGNLAEVFNGPYSIYSPQYQYALVETSSKSNPLSSPKYRGTVDIANASPQTVTAGTQLSVSGVTTLPLTSDSLGNGFVNPTVGQSNKWLINVSQAGDYTLTLKTPTTFFGTGRISISTSDVASLGTYTFGGASTNALTTLKLHAGLNTLEITTLSPFNTLNLTLTPKSGPVITQSGLADTGFETAQLSTGSFVYSPAGSPWTFSGASGITANGSAFTLGNPNAPEGKQVAFLQNQSAISQTFHVGEAGAYRVLYSIAQRANFDSQSIEVLIDDQSVGGFTTSSSSYTDTSTTPFVLTPGFHLLTFKGVSYSGDLTAFLDNINLVAEPPTGTVPVTQNPPAGTSIPFADSGFENIPVGYGLNGFAYTPTSASWSFTGLAGVTSSNSAFTAGGSAAPQGQQVAFVQNQGSLSQTINDLAAGTYHLNFAMAQRTNFTNTPETFQVLVDNQVVGTFTTSSGTYETKSSSSITLGSGTHVFTFRGMNNSGDSTVFLDSINLVAEVATENGPVTNSPTAGTSIPFADSGFENIPVGYGLNGFAYTPTSASWSFTGLAGVTSSNSAFTAGGSAAPQGQQVAFVQNQGSLSQTINDLAAGTYHLNFAMAQRTNFTNTPETFQVLVDNQVVGTFTTSSGTYETKSSSSITLGSGTHVFTFRGMNNSGDSTVFLDSINLVAEGSFDTGSTNPATPSGIADAGFEDASAGSGFYGFVNAPTGTAWTFTEGAGITANQTAFTAGNPNAPEGGQVGFLVNQGAIAQVVNINNPGAYQLSFFAAQRANYADQVERIQVLVDDQLLMTWDISSHDYLQMTTPVFSLSAGSHVITIKGVTPSGAGTAFLDKISLDAV